MPAENDGASEHPIPQWQSLAANAAGAILGWPHLGPETAHAALSHLARIWSKPVSRTSHSKRARE